MTTDRKPIPSPSAASDWRELAAKASTEADPARLSDLVRQLCDRLDDIEHKKKPPQSDASAVDAGKPLQKGE